MRESCGVAAWCDIEAVAAMGEADIALDHGCSCKLVIGQWRSWFDTAVA